MFFDLQTFLRAHLSNSRVVDKKEQQRRWNVQSDLRNITLIYELHLLLHPRRRVFGLSIASIIHDTKSKTL
ncbi:MAG: hypothetical protein AUJ07_09760 [Crenarchaeota archaeon 13_1_40CM_3_53_5]|nr:MAG: hypothetical protein AUJ07_09760 [Crenarchaeota archaeon 13_1_40CM_3_53_5]